MFKPLKKFDYNFSWPAFQVRAAVPHDVQRRAVHGDDVQFGVQREAARGHGLPGLGVTRSRSDCRETEESFIGHEPKNESTFFCTLSFLNKVIHSLPSLLSRLITHEARTCR